MMPEQRDEATVLDALSSAIVAACPLRPPDGEPLQGENVPGPLRHGTFQIDPGSGSFLGSGAPGSLLGHRQQVVVTVRHDYTAGAHDESYRLAVSEFNALKDALLSQPDAFRILQPELVSFTCTRKGHEIVQTLTLTVTYQRRVPPLPE